MKTLKKLRRVSAYRRIREISKNDFPKDEENRIVSSLKKFKKEEKNGAVHESSVKDFLSILEKKLGGGV